MSDTPRTDELKNKIERCLLSQEAYDICSEILDQAQQLERELNDAKSDCHILKQDIAMLKDPIYLNEVAEQQDDRPRFKPGDKVWFMSDNKPFQAEVNTIEQTRSATTYHMGRGWIDSHNVFATKQELIESL